MLDPMRDTVAYGDSDQLCLPILAVLQLPTYIEVREDHSLTRNSMLIKWLCSELLALFPLPVFDWLQYANMEGEGLGDLVTCNHGYSEVDTWGGGV